MAQHDLEAALRHETFHDSLTGLANRALLHDRVEHALDSASRRHGSVAVCFCDIDGLNGVNENLGHHAGDELLIIAAKRLSSIVRPGDTVARVAGDEFAILLDNIESVEAVEGIGGTHRLRVRQPVTIDGQELSPSASVGVAVADVGITAETLLGEGDAAMYAAKAAGMDCFAVYESGMGSRIVDRLYLDQFVPGPLYRGDFFLEYQPQHRLSDGALEGFEALVRWQHPILGLVGPDQFIPLAEETGFIVPLGRWILEQACIQAASWPPGPNHP